MRRVAVLVAVGTFLWASGFSPPVMGQVIENPWIVNDRVADTRNITTMGQTYINAYTPDGVVSPTSDEEKAINIYNNQKRRLYHWADEPPQPGGNSISDPTYNQNVFGWALCGRHADQACTIASAAGLGTMKVGVPGHWIYQVQYSDSTWHFYDTMTTCYIYNRANPASVASCAEIKADNSLILDAVAEGRACPGFLLCGDTASWFASVMNSWSNSGSGVQTARWTGDMNLRPGEVFERTWEAWENQHPTPATNADTMPGNDPPYHHESQHDWKDSVNWPYWEPYGQTLSYIHTGKATYRRWANGTHTVTPDFRSAAYQDLLYSSSNIATYYQDGITPDLHASTVNTLAEAVFQVQIPFYMTDGVISGNFKRTNSGDVTKILVSSNGTSWTEVWNNTAIGTTQLTNFSLRSQVFGKYNLFYVKVQIKAVNALTDAGVTGLTFSVTFNHNKGAMAYLDKGVNNISVTCGNAQALGANWRLKITYQWKEYDGSGWNISKSYVKYANTSPANFTIVTGGTKVPRTESIRMEIVPTPAPDITAPGAVSNLACGSPGRTSMPLTWTATGDDGSTGQATAYDLRRSTSPINASNFSSATQVANVPVPRPAGGAESFTVTGLTPSTTYYFAIKAIDEDGNAGPISNVASATTMALDNQAPNAVTNLAASPLSTWGSWSITWTAPADNGNGYVAQYDLRWSTSPIDANNFANATQFTGEPTPGSAGSSQSYTASGLPTGRTLYFAIKSADDSGNWSAISNLPSATQYIGEKTFQNGLDGYNGAQDSYLSAAAVTTKYDGSNYLQICGFADQASTNRRRPIVKFNLTSIPTGAQITKATLYLYAYSNEQHDASGGYYAAHRVFTPWSANNVSWNMPWVQYGGGDIESTPDAQAAKQSSSGVWYAFDVTTRVQNFIANPGNNNGWVIKCNNEQLHNQDWFYACEEATNTQLRPKLVITDDPSGGDTTPPAAVNNLATSNPTSNSITLTWTAPGDDGSTGTAASYDIRYRTGGAVNDSNWASATQVTGEPTPQAAGTVQSMVVTGLSPSTTYYFAIKTSDEATNTSAISNSPSGTTQAPDNTPPAAVTDLAASTVGASGGVNLTWTAPGDDGNTGTASSYDLRYSTSPINASNFASATAVPGVGAPKPAGSTEVYSISGLTIGQTYYFALKTSDEVPNVSALSNVVSATAVMGELTFQDGLNGYSGCVDTYLSAASPTSNYGAFERMVVTGYEDQGAVNRQRGLVKFDLTSIPTGTTIQRATLYLYSYDAAQAKGSNGYYGVYPVTTAWAEGSATWNSPWSSAGGDFSTTPDATAAKQTGAGVWYAFDVTSRVQQWIATPSSNNGWLVKCTDEMLHNQDYFYQSETSNTGYRPKLVVTDVAGFTVSTLSNPTAGGTVSGGGVYSSGQLCTLTATPATEYGYTFVQWSGGPVNGQTTNPVSFTVTGDQTITAVFQGPAGYIDVTNFAELKNAIQSQATPGTTIRVHPGTYQLQDTNGRLSLYNAGTAGNPIKVIGVGATRPILEPAPGQEINRGFFHIWPTDNYWIFENLEFRNLRGTSTYDPNAAAAYIQGDNITFRNCKIHDCDQGFSSSIDSSNCLIEYCEIYNCGTDLNPGYAHLMYMMNDSLTVRGCYLHDAYQGMCFKTRCANLTMEYNWLENDGNQAFVAGISSNNTANSLWRGNVLIKRSTAGGQRRILSLYDNSGSLSGTVTFINNTFVSARTEDIFIHHVAGSTANVVFKNNIFAGPATTLLDWNVNGSQLSGTNNMLMNSVSVPAQFTNTVVTADAGFVNLATRDLHLLSGSPCVNAGQNNPTYLNASGQSVVGTPQYEPTKLLAVDTRFADTTLDIGAFEYYPPVPSVAFNAATSSGSEGTTSVNLPVSLSYSHSQQVTVQYEVIGGSATGGGTDYTLASGQLTFNVGVTTQNIPVTINDDTLDEDDETIQVRLFNPSNAVLGAIAEHTYTIQDNDNAPTVQFSAATSSGSESATSVQLTVSLSAASGKTVTVAYAATGGSASSPADYTISGTGLTFTPGQTSKTISITVVDDTLTEGNETIEVTLSNPVNATAGTNMVHTYTIIDNELPTVQFQATSSSGSEGSSPANLVVTLSQSSSQQVRVRFAVTGGTATQGSDYTLPTGSTGGIVALKRSSGLSIDRGLATQFADAIASGTIQVYSGQTMAADTSLYYSPSWATYQNYHNFGGDGAIRYGNWPIFSKFDLASLPGFAGSTINKAQLRFYYSAGNTGLAKTGYVTFSDWIEGTATGAYPGSAGGLSAAHPMGYNTSQNQDADGGTTGPLQSWANNDFFDVSKDVSAEYVTVSKYGYSAGGDTSGGFAVYDVTSFVQDFADGTVPNYGFCTYDSALNYTVQFSETNRGAEYQPVLCIDYTAVSTSDTVVFDPGETTKSIPITIIDDSATEGNETIEITLSNPDGAVLGSNTVHTYTIVDNEAAPPQVQFQVTSDSGSEGTRQAYLTVTLSQSSSQTVTVDYSATGSATADSDYIFGTSALQAFKRDATLTHTDPLGTGNSDASALDDRFEGLGDNDVVTTTVSDTQLVPGDWAGFGWKNWGAATTADGDSDSEYILFRHDLSMLSAGTIINKAELRLYLTSGNSGTSLSRLLTAWSEGNKDGGYPGNSPAAAGASCAHPNGLNTNSNQLADGTPGTAGSWAAGHFSASDYDMTQSRKAANNRWAVWDLTSIVQSWMDGDPNYGVTITNANYTYRFSEAGADRQPVLFVDYMSPVSAQTVTFAPGETSKTIPIAVVDDATAENSETIVVTLSNPVNAILGTNTSCTYTITDND